MAEWRNWAGDQRCTPAEIVRPRDEGEVAAAVARARERGLKVRAAGAGHSFQDVVLTDGMLLDLGALDRVVDHDPDSGVVRVQGGVRLHALGPQLAARGLALENQGDIDAQALAGALMTGTHGTGERFRNLSANVVGMRIVDGRGELRELTDPDELRAARVSLGAVGVVTEIALRCVPLFGLRRVDEPEPLGPTLDRLDELVAGHDHLELFVFPYTDKALVRRSWRLGPDLDPSPRWRARLQEDVLENTVLGAACRAGRRWPSRIPAINRGLVAASSRTEKRDVAFRVYANRRSVRFTEMEYALPRAAGREAVERVLGIVAERRLPVGFPIEVRFVAGDDAFLSPAGGRDTCYLAFHQFQGMDWREPFAAVEEILDGLGGRPHWGKRHSQTAATLAPRYPQWEAFQAVRERLDPDRVFTSPAIERVLGP
ncbi:MAG TPA: D-arabinono-1,4-lactone oxidase [Casimicrobiaceae bacterium]